LKPSKELAKLTQIVVDQQKVIGAQQKTIEVLTKKVLVLEGGNAGILQGICVSDK